MNPTMVFLDAIRDHLDLHPFGPVASVSVTSGPDPVSVQLRADGLVEVASALMTWVGTLDDVTARIWRVPSGHSVHLIVEGRMPCGAPVYVYSSVPHTDDVFPDLPVGAKQDIPVFVLRQWARPEGVAA